MADRSGNLMTPDDKAPADPYAAAAWIVKRHPWAGELARRVVGRAVDQNVTWIDDLAQAVLDSIDLGIAWEEYERRNPVPREQTDERAYERALDQWQNDGPQGTPGARAYGPMSSGEKRGVRLLATLSRKRVPWRVQDVDFDQRGALMLLDIQAVERAQLPAELFDPNYDPEAMWRRLRTRRALEGK